MAPKKRAAAAPKAAAAAPPQAEPVRKRPAAGPTGFEPEPKRQLYKFAFVKPKSGQDPVAYVEEEIRKAKEVIQAQFTKIEQLDEHKSKDIHFVVKHLWPIMEHQAKMNEWLVDRENNGLTVVQMDKIRQIATLYLNSCFNDSETYTLKPINECMKKRWQDIEKASEMARIQHQERKAAHAALLAQIASIQRDRKDREADQKKKLERKKNEAKVIDEMFARLDKNLENAKSRRKALMELARQNSEGASSTIAVTQAPQRPSMRELVEAAQRPKPMSKPAAKPKPKAKAKGKAAPFETHAQALSRRDYEMDRRMRIAEAAQPIPGLMPQFNEAGQTVGWMDTYGNWISGETSRGSKKLLLHLKALNYDPRADPDKSDDSTPVVVRPASTPPGLDDITPISRLSENGGGHSTTDIPTSPERDAPELPKLRGVNIN